MLDWLVDASCNFDGAAANALGWTRPEYAPVSAAVTGALAWGFLATWLFAFGKIRRAGLARRQQRLVWWFAFSVALAQIALTMLAGIGIEPIPCPWSTLVLPVLSLLFLLMAYGFHVQDENRASFPKFLGIVALPVLGEVAITAKATVSAVISVIVWILRNI